jgi:hypothetical protein
MPMVRNSLRFLFSTNNELKCGAIRCDQDTAIAVDLIGLVLVLQRWPGSPRRFTDV